MNIIRFIESETRTQTYLICSANSNAIIIDSVYSEVDKYLRVLENNKLNLLYALDTHIHADHITGTGLLKQKTNCKIAMGQEAEIDSLDIKLKDQDKISFDNLTITAIHTPGHTVESYCYLIGTRLFTGDCLLINACGRTDFQRGNAALQYDSIFNKLLALPDETLVYPGHDYNNRMVSTIGEQKINNPRLLVNSKEEFITMMENLNLPKPKFMDIAVPRNLQCGLEI